MITLKVIMLISMLTGIMVITGYLLGREKGIIIALIISAVMKVESYWYSDSIVLKMYKS